MALKGTKYRMLTLIRDALNESNLIDVYPSRPAYQQNDYIGTPCVTRTKREATKQKRLKQLLEELEGGKLYMNMKWTKSRAF
jgi:hypothetical protein